MHKLSITTIAMLCLSGIATYAQAAEDVQPLNSIASSGIPSAKTSSEPQPAQVLDDAYIPEMVPIPGKNFEIGKYEVTQAEWRGVMGNNPSKFNKCGNDCPVEKVSWDDIQIYLKKLNAMTGKQYRLPTEMIARCACFAVDHGSMMPRPRPRSIASSSSHPSATAAAASAWPERYRNHLRYSPGDFCRTMSQRLSARNITTCQIIYQIG
jgi:hypothetical protein